MGAALLLLLVFGHALQHVSTPAGPPNLDIPRARSAEDIRVRLQQLWSEVVLRGHNKSVCLSLDGGDIKNVSRGLAALNASGGSLDAVVFYRIHSADKAVHDITPSPRQAICTDKQPAKGHKADTCEKQRTAGYCKARVSGAIQDGVCDRTCGLCASNGGSSVGMRATFAFPRKRHAGVIFAIVDMPPSGHWRVYDLCKSHGSLWVHCSAKPSPTLAHDRVLQVGKPVQGSKTNAVSTAKKCMVQVIRQCEQMRHFEWNNTTHACRCVKGTNAITGSNMSRLLVSSARPNLLYRVNCTDRTKSSNRSAVDDRTVSAIAYSARIQPLTFFPAWLKLFFDRIWQETVALATTPILVTHMIPECMPAETTNLTVIARHTRTIHPDMKLYREAQHRMTYTFHFDDENDDRITVRPHFREVRCVHNVQTSAVCVCPMGGAGVKGIGCPRTGAIKCELCHPFIRTPVGAYYLYYLRGEGVAGKSEIWDIDTGPAKVKSIKSCFEAVLKDSRCTGDYFSYRHNNHTCGCKGSDGELSVRRDARSHFYQIAPETIYKSIAVCVLGYVPSQNASSSSNGQKPNIKSGAVKLNISPTHCRADIIRSSDAVNPTAMLCAGAPDFVDNRDAPVTFCARGTYFNQYILERVMLRRWINTTWSNEINMVVVSSPMFRTLLGHSGVDWSYLATKLCESTFASFWKDVKARFYKPSARYTPVIVVHSSFAWDYVFLHLLNTLLKMQPGAFIDRVVLGSLDGQNIPEPTIALAKKSAGRPLLVTLPYPVGITSVANFSRSYRSYQAPARRRISITFSGRALGKLRVFLRSQFDRVNGTVAETFAYKCAPSHGESKLCGIGQDTNAYKSVANSDFCLEPGGDTPTRSHFYMAILAGCIPVIFDLDGGHMYTGGHWFPFQKTHWAWRHSPRDQLRLDYTTFTVAYNAQDVLRKRKNILYELYMMPIIEPERFHALQLGVARAAKHMHYALEDCGSRNCDAFETFKAVVVARGLELGEGSNEGTDQNIKTP